jgi:uncharacterized protein (DUF1800 family)
VQDVGIAIVACRFGYGLPGGEGFASPGDLDKQLRRATVIPDRFSTASSKERIVANAAHVERLRGFRGTTEERTKIFQERVQAIGAGYQSDSHDRVIFAVESETPFFERLVDFWSNHFTVSGSSGRNLGGPYEVEAIRPNVMGRFEDMLVAVEHHPAMVGYLNLNQSIGPNSPVGKRKGGGLNENLAREILELHTLGVHGGYSQEDVTSFAKIMTGWTIDRQNGEVEFLPARAEPGRHTLLGTSFDSSEESYSQALRMLARHPSTARFIAAKLVTHFIGGSASASAIESVAQAFGASGGNLPSVYEALVRLPESWSPLGSKARTDFEFIVAALRAAGLSRDELLPREVDGQLRPNPLSAGALAQLAQPMWKAPSPAGWPEDPEEWLSPVGLAQRLRWIPKVVGKIHDESVVSFCDTVLGPLASAQTRAVIQAASNREEGISLVLASPEFNRR